MLFAIIAEDRPGGLEQRLKVRPTHLKHLESLGDKLVFAGPFLDADEKPHGSLVVVDAADRAEAEAMAARDPYVTEGLFERYDVRRWSWALNNPTGRRAMAHWLMKSEPDVLSYDDVVAKGVPEEWHGVRNYAARNNMKAMQLGDECFFYHSNIGKEIVGIVRVVALAHPDSTAELKDGKVVWECVDVLPVRKLPRPVTLEQIKSTPGLENMALVKLSRLSVGPVTDAEWEIVCRLGGL